MHDLELMYTTATATLWALVDDDGEILTYLWEDQPYV